MKKSIIYILGIFFIVLSFASCKSKKGGCGLSSDAHKIEQATTINNSRVATVK